jgi:hypothetical protein
MSEHSALLLAEHHHVIEAACRELLGRTYSDEPADLVAEYRRFEHEMLEHIAIEEELLLPAYAEHAPEDARALREDHAALRQLMYRIGIDVELHLVRAKTVDQLIAQLRAHAVREENGLYVWAADHAPASARQQSVDRIRRSLRELARLTGVRRARALDVQTPRP